MDFPKSFISKRKKFPPTKRNNLREKFNAAPFLSKERRFITIRKRQVLRIVTVKNKQNKGKKLKFLLLRIFQKNQALFQIRFQKRYFEAAQDNSPKNL